MKRNEKVPTVRKTTPAPLAGIPTRAVEGMDGEEHPPETRRRASALSPDGAATPEAEIAKRDRATLAAAHLAALVTSAEDAIASKTLEGIVTSWNASAERMFGYTAEEMIGQSILRIIPADRHDEEDLILARIRAGQRIEHFETVRVAKDGHPIEVSLTISPIRDNTGTIIGASKIARDITARKRADEALKASEAALRASQAQLAADLADMTLLQRISSQLVHEGDLDALYGQILDAAISVMRSDMGSMQMLYPERNELRLLAWRGFDPASAAFWEWVRVDSGSTCGVALETGERVLVPDVEACDFMAGTEDLDSYRLSGITAVQSTPLVSRGGRLVGMISTHWRTRHEPSARDLHLLDLLARQAADLIERVRAQEALRESEVKFRTLADNIPTLAWMARPTGDTFWYNHRWYEYTGTTPETQEGWGWQSVHDPDVLPQVMEKWQRSLATGEPFEMVFPLRGADGVFRPFLTRVVPVRDERGAVVRWFGTNTDISDLRAAEEALRAANQRKDEFLGIASHELRTPLTSAKANVQIVARRLARALESSAADSGAALAKLQPLQRLLEHSEGALDRLNRLVQDLLDDSRIQGGKLELRPQRMDLTALVRDAADEEAQGWPGREVQLEGRLSAQRGRADAAPDKQVWVEADPDRIREVVGNYLSNAFKYAPPDQPISVRLEVDPAAHGGVARVAVRDHGPGLTPEQQARLFERFYRVEGITHQQGSNLGLGLGLYICQTIIERHGGQVGVESVPGMGSTFWFTLPLAGLPAGADASDADAVDSAHPG